MTSDMHIGDSLRVLQTFPDQAFNCCVTSPPYWGLRDYGHDGQIGLEDTPDAYVERMVEVFREVRRVLRDDGTLWLNLGDSYATSGTQGPNSGLAALADKYAPRKNPRNPNRDDSGNVPRVKKTMPPGLKPKDLVGIPWRVAFALQADGWYLRSDIIWHKPNPMPESVRDRPTKAHEYVFLMSKSARYYYDAEAIREPAIHITSGNVERKMATGGERQRTNTHMGSSIPWINDGTGRNKRDVWTVTTKPYHGAHFAVFPEDLIKPCILAGCPEGGIVLDPFLGSGTTARVAMDLGRKWCGIEINPDYEPLIKERTSQLVLWDWS